MPANQRTNRAPRSFWDKPFLGRELIKRIVTPVRTLIEVRIGPIRQWALARKEARAPRSVEASIQVIQQRWGVRPGPVAENSQGGPIFILAAGWRSGSTLLQRLVCSSETVLVWGEPYDYCDLIRSLAESLSVISEDYPPENFLAASMLPGTEPGVGHLWDSWIANLYPNPVDLVSAHRAFLIELFQAPATRQGYVRWGLKDVRLKIEHAVYLKWLFPKAEFIFLYRNPYDAYRSFRPCRGWYDRFPDRPVLTPYQFGKHWRDLCESFVTGYTKVDGTIISYERLLSDDACVRELEQRLAVNFKREVLRERVGGTLKRDVPKYEIRALKRAVEPLASALGYQA